MKSLLIVALALTIAIYAMFWVVAPAFNSAIQAIDAPSQIEGGR